MSDRALEFVETWVSEKIEDMSRPIEADDAKIKALAAECIQAALDEGIPASEINDDFDNLAEFIAGEIEEAQDREADRDDDNDLSLIEDDDARLVDDDEDEAAKDK
jgi:hypothetical protein